MRKLPLSFRGALAVALLPHVGASAQAQDASFGCKVLLCAAASQPGWQSIPYCVPVMQELFAGLRKGRGWPICSEANASAPGYEPFHPCPNGSFAATLEAGQAIASLSGDACVRPRAAAPPCDEGSRDSCGAVDRFEVTPRSRRADPYFVDIAGAGQGGVPTRFRFNLQP